LAARLPETDALGREAAQLIDSEAARLYDAMHGMIPRLTPLALGPLGLPDALRDLVASLRRRHPGFEFSLRTEGPDTPVDPGPALVAYRTAQEALNNAIKHSGGTHLDLLLTRDTHTMTLTLTDDGRGLPPPGERPERFGLPGLRERAAALGGDFVAERRPEGGTRVSVHLPCQAPAEMGGRP
jgi:two-component system sensor histidine kinase UhpB